MNNAERPHVDYIAQLLMVVLIAAALNAVTDWLNFRSIWNLVWMALLPAGLGVVLNRGWGRQAFMLMALTAVSLLRTVLVGAVLGGI